MNLTTSQTNHISIELTAEDLKRAVLDFAAKVYMGHSIGEGFDVVHVGATCDDPLAGKGMMNISGNIVGLKMTLAKTTVKP